MTSIATQVAEALRAAGRAESVAVGGMATTGFFALQVKGRVTVVPIIGDDVEGHFDSPAHHDMAVRMTAGYRQALEAAGLTVTVHPSGEALTAEPQAKVA